MHLPRLPCFVWICSMSICSFQTFRNYLFYAAAVLEPFRNNFAYLSGETVHVSGAFMRFCLDIGGALDSYILNQDISKWHFSPHGAVSTAPCLSRLCFPSGISLERAVRIDVSSANFRTKSYFQVRTLERNPIFRCRPLKCPSLGPPETLTGL